MVERFDGVDDFDDGNRNTRGAQAVEEQEQPIEHAVAGVDHARIARAWRRPTLHPVASCASA